MTDGDRPEQAGGHRLAPHAPGRYHLNWIFGGRWTVRIASFIAFMLLAAPLFAAQYAPRVLSPHVADTYSMKTFAQFPRWRDLTGDAKVYEIYRYLADTRTGLFPMGCGAWEGTDVMYEYGYIRDPVKMINVYALGYCDMLGPTMEGIMKDMGIGLARTVNLPGLDHVMAEVFYEGRWHYLDLDLRGVFRRADGSLASVEEARRDASLWEHPAGPLFFPNDHLAGLRRAYADSPVAYRYGVNMGGHTMDYVLRQGETFTRWWRPQGQRWNHHPSYHQGHFLTILQREPVGPKSKHIGFSIHGTGNGRFVYRPNLTEQSTDFHDGCYEASNVRPGPMGLAPAGEGSGYAILEIRSPYVIVPEVHEYATTEDDTGASVVRMEGERVGVSLSTDNGITWQPVSLSEGTADLTRFISGRYGYLLKLHLEPRSLVRSLEITTWVQVHPASLPALRQGHNEMRYVTGDHYGLNSHVVEVRPFANNPEDLLKFLAEPPADYDPQRTTDRIRGRFVAKVQAPPGTRIAWFSAGGSFLAHQDDEAPKTANTMAYAVEAPRGFTPIYRAQVPAGQSHWHYNADIEVRLKEPARTVYVEYVGDPGVNNIRIYAHCVPDRAPEPSRVVITHTWREGDQARSKQVALRGPGSYEIICAGEPTDESIEIAVPSVVTP